MSVFRYNRYWIEKFEVFYNGKRTMWASATNDTSVLSSDVDGNNFCGQTIDDYSLYGYDPIYFWVTVIYGALALPIGLGMVIGALFGSNNMFGMTEGVIGSVLLAILWGLFRLNSVYVYNKFIIFDRINRLVHIPIFFGKDWDVVPFDQADFALVEIPGHLRMNFSPTFFVCRPPGDLTEEGVNTDKKKYLVKVFGGSNQEEWAYLVAFMNYEQNEIQKRNIFSLNELDPSYEREMEDGSKVSFYKFIKKYRRFDPSKLATQPNWVRDESGAWQRVEGK